MQEEEIFIKLVNIVMEDGNKYQIEIEERATFKELKKMINAKAHLLKDSYQIFKDNQTLLSNDYDDICIKDIFLKENPIAIHIFLLRNIYEKELTCFSFDPNNVCELHYKKMKMFYCKKCSKSICYMCAKDEHLKSHTVEDKTDYLRPAKIIMSEIFENSSKFIADSKFSKNVDCMKFKNKLKSDFTNLRNWLNSLENELLSCLEFFMKSESNSKASTNTNLNLLQQFCCELFIEYKNEIFAESMIVDENKFLKILKKLEEIKKFKDEFFEKNVEKYKNLNELLFPFINIVEKIIDELGKNFQNIINNDICENFKRSIKENIVEQVKREKVNEEIFKRSKYINASLEKDRNSYPLIQKSFQKIIPSFEEKERILKTSLNAKKKTTANTNAIYTYPLINKLKDISFPKNNKIHCFNYNKNRSNNEQSFSTLLSENSNNIINCKISANQFPALNEPLFKFMSPIFDSNTIIGAFENEKTKKVEVNFGKVFEQESLVLNTFLQGGAFCNLDKFLYFSGGHEIQKGLGKTFYRVSIFKNDNFANIEKLPYMLDAHCNHSIISNGYYLFAIGGSNSNKCEYFNLLTNEWKKMANLECNERQRSMLTFYKKYLYSFMGISKDGVLDSAERINIENLESNKWEMISISNPSSINLHFWGAAIFEDNDILYFLGGKYGQGNDENDYKNDIYEFSSETMAFSDTNLIANYLFYMESKMHRLSKEKIGNFMHSRDDVLLVTINPSELLN